MVDSTSWLYHAANVEPEVARMARAYMRGDTTQGDMFKQKSLAIVKHVLASTDVSSAGKEEWSAFAALLAIFESLEADVQRVITTYGLPFSMRFALVR